MNFSIAVWNIRHGGGSRRAGISEAMAQVTADAIVIPEWSPNGDPSMAGLLEKHGFRVVAAADKMASRNYSVAIASRGDIRPGPLSLRCDPTRLAHAVVNIGRVDVHVLGAYVPSGSPDMDRKRRHLRELTDLTALLSADRPFVLAGDMNCDHLDATGSRDPRLVGMPEFAALIEAGWVDANRLAGDVHLPTWWVPGRDGAFRLDHVLTRGPIAPITVETLTHLNGRAIVSRDKADQPLSDHAMVIANFTLDG